MGGAVGETGGGVGTGTMPAKLESQYDSERK